MPNVKTAEEATDLVQKFVWRHFGWGGRPISAKKENAFCILEVDVGVFATEVGRVRLDAATGDVQEYDFPR